MLPGFFSMPMKIRKILVLSLLPIITISLFLAYLLIKKSPSPAAEIRQANDQIQECLAVKGGNYASLKLQEARNYYDSSVNKWRDENQRWIIFRNYDASRNHALKASELARQAIAESLFNENQTRQNLEKIISEIQKNFTLYDSVLHRIPLNGKERQNLNNGKIKYSEGLLLYEKNDFPGALKKIASAALLLDPLAESCKARLQKYFTSYDQWMKDLEATLKWSRDNKSRVILIDKFSGKCQLFENGNLVSEYGIELGKNPLEDKTRQGDFATPEGIYEVIKKKSGIHTRYHKALLINYPNDEDKEVFQQKKKAGVLDPDDKIGGAIEIHGHGGKGADWTEGCIALRNEEMDAVYNFARVGTRVTIAGSVKPLSDFLSEKDLANKNIAE